MTPKGETPAISRRIGGVLVVEQALPIGTGKREGIASKDGEPAYVGVVYIAAGLQLGYSNNKEEGVSLGAGSLAVWHTSQSLAVRVVEPVRKYTFLFPEGDIAICMAERCNVERCNVVSPDSPLGPMVGGFFEGLTRRLDDLPERYHESAISMVREVVTKALLTADCSRDKSPADLTLDRLLEHINRNLHDPDLSPETLANAQSISVRYLHLLFSRRGIQVATWIRQRRLEACRIELATAPDAVTITSIALKWGFNDSSHFSRLFSSTFGVSPAAYRRQARKLDE